MDVSKPCPGLGSGRDKFNHQYSGFTLIELLIVLAIISTLALSVSPSISSLLAKERSVVLTNKLASSLAFARSESITKQQIILTCQSNDGSQCHRSENWQNGWITFADHNGNKQRDPDENLLQVVSALSNGVKATFRGSAGIRHYLRYKPTGEAFPNGSFLICHPDFGTGRALIVTHSGRVRLSKVQTNNLAITCN